VIVKSTLWATDNNRETTIALTRQLGMMASSLEHQVPESLFNNEENPGEAVSAVKALAIAAKEGQRIYTVTHENVDSVLPIINVRTDVKDDIRNAVAVGKVATVSQNQVTVGNWRGVGYIITDPNIGTGAYMISGGDNGSYITGFLCAIVAMLGIFIMSTAAFPAIVATLVLPAGGLVLFGATFLLLAIGVASLRVMAYGTEQLTHLNKGVGKALMTLFGILGVISFLPMTVAYVPVAALVGAIVSILYGIRAFLEGLDSYRKET